MGYEGSDPVVNVNLKQLRKNIFSLSDQDKQKFLDNIKRLFDAGVGV